MTEEKKEEPAEVSTETQEVIDKGGAADPAQHDDEVDAAAEEELPLNPVGDELDGEFIEGDETPDTPTLPGEVKEALEAEYPVLREHGTHDAAMKGLQTDASGSYTPPGLVKKD